MEEKKEKMAIPNRYPLKANSIKLGLNKIKNWDLKLEALTRRVLKNFAKVTGKYLRQNLFFN